jgi:hypothetical protein
MCGNIRGALGADATKDVVDYRSNFSNLRLIDRRQPPSFLYIVRRNEGA